MLEGRSTLPAVLSAAPVVMVEVVTNGEMLCADRSCMATSGSPKNTEIFGHGWAKRSLFAQHQDPPGTAVLHCSLQDTCTRVILVSWDSLVARSKVDRPPRSFGRPTLVHVSFREMHRHLFRALLLSCVLFVPSIKGSMVPCHTYWVHDVIIVVSHLLLLLAPHCYLLFVI